MSEQLTACPHCGADLIGEEIPEKQRQMFGGHTHFNRLIGQYDPDRDRVVQWECPDCHQRWARP